ncbi:MAG: PAS domain S-box protein [Thermodesulfobacteriota bacterium]
MARRLLDSWPARVAILDSSGVIVHVNKPWADFARDQGLDHDQTGRNYLTVRDQAAESGPNEAAEAAAGIRSVIRGVTPVFLKEYACSGPAGRSWFLMRATRLAGPGSTLIVVSHEDITERKLAEEELRASLDRLYFIGQNMPVLLEAFDADRHIIVWNREAERVSGYSAGEIVGNPRALELLYPDKAYREYMLNEVKKRGYDFRDWEWEITRKDGSIRTISWFNVSRHFPIPGWNSWAIGVDITDRVKAKRELEAKERELQLHAEKLKEINTALKVLLDQREQEKRQQIKDMAATLEKLVFPYLERFQQTGLDKEQAVFLEVVRSNLDRIISPLASRLTGLESSLTPAEIEVAELLRLGKTSGQIAGLLNLSIPTVSTHRSNIRRKLGLTHNKINLKSYLRGFF